MLFLNFNINYSPHLQFILFIIFDMVNQILQKHVDVTSRKQYFLTGKINSKIIDLLKGCNVQDSRCLFVMCKLNKSHSSEMKPVRRERAEVTMTKLPLITYGACRSIWSIVIIRKI